MVEVVVADDHAVLVDVLTTSLNSRGFTVRGHAYSLRSTVGLVESIQPRVCVLDRHFGDGDALDILPELLSASPDTKVLVLTADIDPSGIRRAMRTGASGYLHKGVVIDQLVRAIRSLAAGEQVWGIPSARQVRQPRSTRMDARRLAEFLTARERDCLALLMDGATTGEMADQWGVSTTTVRTHVRAILTKLGVHSRPEAVSLAAHHNLIAR